MALKVNIYIFIFVFVSVFLYAATMLIFQIKELIIASEKWFNYVFTFFFFL